MLVESFLFTFGVCDRNNNNNNKCVKNACSILQK